MSVAFVLAFLATLFFGVRLIVFTFYWADPEHRFQTLEGWMTPRYIAHSYGLPPEMVAGILDIGQPAAHRRTLDEILRESGQSMADFQRRLTEITASGAADAQ